MDPILSYDRIFFKMSFHIKEINIINMFHSELYIFQSLYLQMWCEIYDQYLKISLFHQIPIGTYTKQGFSGDERPKRLLYMEKQ
jgi:hypothetical protein